MRGIFIMSSERSGSNLLRSILDSHEAISAPPALQLLRQFDQLLHYYGNLEVKDNFEQLKTDILKVVNLKGTQNEWAYEIRNSDLKNLKNTYKNRFLEIVFEVYAAHAHKDGNEIFVCKENNIFDYAINILYNYPDSKIIYLVRDGRDVATSEKKIKFRKRHIYLISEKWVQEQEKSIKVYQNLGSNKVFILKYEELLLNTREVLIQICNFLEINYGDHLLNFHKRKNIKEQSTKSEFWKNISSPILKNNIGKFRNNLSQNEIKIFESLSWEVLSILNYRSVNGSPKKISHLEELKYRIYNKLLKRFSNSEKKAYNHRYVINQTIEQIKRERKSHLKKIVS